MSTINMSQELEVAHLNQSPVIDHLSQVASLVNEQIPPFRMAFEHRGLGKITPLVLGYATKEASRDRLMEIYAARDMASGLIAIADKAVKQGDFDAAASKGFTITHGRDKLAIETDDDGNTLLAISPARIGGSTTSPYGRWDDNFGYIESDHQVDGQYVLAANGGIGKIITNPQGEHEAVELAHGVYDRNVDNTIDAKSIADYLNLFADEKQVFDSVRSAESIRAEQHTPREIVMATLRRVALPR